MPDDVQELFSEVSCYACYGFSTEQLLTLAELQRILLSVDPTADTSVNGLLSTRSCLGCYNFSLFQMVELALFTAIDDATSATGSFLSRSGITDPTQIAAVTQLYLDAVAHGWWDMCDVIYPFVGGTAQAHAQNLKSNNYTVTWVGGVTHNAAGITGNGTTGYGTTSYIPALSSILTLNSAHLLIYRTTTGGITSRYLAAAGGGAGVATMGRGIAVNAVSAGINCISAETFSVSALGSSMTTRLDAATLHIYSGLVDNSYVSASTSVSSLQLYLLANNNNGAPANFTTANLEFATAGSGFTFAQYAIMKTDIQTFQTTLGRGV